MAAAAGGLDVLAFTGGVGENSTVVRGRAAQRLAFLGIGVDAGLDEAGLRGPRASGGAVEITASGAAVRTFVVAAREDLAIPAGEPVPSPPSDRAPGQTGGGDSRTGSPRTRGPGAGAASLPLVLWTSCSVRCPVLSVQLIPRARPMVPNRSVWLVIPRTLAACGPLAAMRTSVPVCCWLPG